MSIVGIEDGSDGRVRESLFLGSDGLGGFKLPLLSGADRGEPREPPRVSSSPRTEGVLVREVAEAIEAFDGRFICIIRVR